MVYDGHMGHSLLWWLQYTILIVITCSYISHYQAFAESSTPRVQTALIPYVDGHLHARFIPTSQPGACTVLLLHGMRFNSSIWEQTGTMRALAAPNRTVIALDLPGFGNSNPLAYVDNNVRSDVLHTVFKKLGGDGPRVLLTPSMSGKHGLAYMERHYDDLDTWIPVAPSGVQAWSGPPDFAHKYMRLLAMYGENDPAKSDYAKLHSMFRHAQVAIIGEAGHSPFVDQPELFNEVLSTKIITYACTPMAAPDTAKPDRKPRT